MTKYEKIVYLILLTCTFLTSKAQNMQRVQQTIDTLCSQTMLGRGYVNKGDIIAANYIKKRFEEIGVKPIKEKYFQYFKLDINTFPKKIKLKLGKQKLQIGEDFILNSISKSGKGRAKILHLDTAIFTNKEVQQSFLDQKVSKTAIVYDQKYQTKFLDLPREVFEKIYQAKAIIELQSTKLTASLSSQQITNPYFQLKKEDFDFEAKKIKFRVEAELIKNRISQNVLGFIEGTQEPDSFLVLTGHYDHLGAMGQAYFPGANDNASGISMILEMANYYAKNPHKYSILLIAFGAEEAGLIGSRYYVHSPWVNLENMKVLVNLDLVGTGDEGMTIVNGAIFKEDFEKILQINKDKKYLPTIKKRGVAANSDHYFFSENGVKAFFFYTLGGITAYHDINDIAKTLPLTRYKEVFALIKDYLNTYK